MQIIDIISPSSSISSAELAQISQFLAQKGLKSRFFMEDELLLEAQTDNLFPAFPAKKRAQQLKMAFESDSEIIWCARGGYGCSDLLEFLEDFAPKKKIFVGFSDVTALATHFWQNFKQKTFYAPMIKQLSQQKLTKNSEKTAFEAVFGRKNEFFYEISTLFAKNEEKLSGILVGGCLSLILHGLATQNQLDFGGKILFLEDIDERGEKIERGFMQILQAAKRLNSYPKAILLGNFKQNFTDKQKTADIDQAIAGLVGKIREDGLDIAVLEEVSGCLGHTDDMRPVVIGGEVEIEQGRVRVLV